MSNSFIFVPFFIDKPQIILPQLIRIFVFFLIFSFFISGPLTLLMVMVCVLNNLWFVIILRGGYSNRVQHSLKYDHHLVM